MLVHVRTCGRYIMLFLNVHGVLFRFFRKYLSIFYWVVNGVSVLVYDVLLYKVYKVNTVEKFVRLC
jgi:hypothetical protein